MGMADGVGQRSGPSGHFEGRSPKARTQWGPSPCSAPNNSWGDPNYWPMSHVRRLRHRVMNCPTKVIPPDGWYCQDPNPGHCPPANLHPGAGDHHLSWSLSGSLLLPHSDWRGQGRDA